MADLLFDSGIDVRHQTARIWWNRFEPMVAGEMLESYVSKTRDKLPPFTLMQELLKRHGSPDAITTHGLRRFRAAVNALGNVESQRWDAGPATVWRTAICPSDDESAMLRFRQRKS